jgi:hypothetical protein
MAKAENAVIAIVIARSIGGASTAFCDRIGPQTDHAKGQRGSRGDVSAHQRVAATADEGIDASAQRAGRGPRRRRITRSAMGGRCKNPRKENRDSKSGSHDTHFVKMLVGLVLLGESKAYNTRETTA